MREIDFTEIFHLWSSGGINSDDIILGIKVFWWERAGKVLQFVSGLVIVVDLLGTERLRIVEQSILQVIKDIQILLIEGIVRITPDPRNPLIFGIEIKRSFIAIMLSSCIFITWLIILVVLMSLSLKVTIAKIVFSPNVLYALVWAFFASYTLLLQNSTMLTNRQAQNAVALMTIGWSVLTFIPVLMAILASTEMVSTEKFIVALITFITSLLNGSRIALFNQYLGLLISGLASGTIYIIYYLLFKPIIFFLNRFSLEKSVLLGSLLIFVMGFFLDFLAS
jgi:hypothetical protein